MSHTPKQNYDGDISKVKHPNRRESPEKHPPSKHNFGNIRTPKDVKIVDTAVVDGQEVDT